MDPMNPVVSGRSKALFGTERRLISTLRRRGRGAGRTPAPRCLRVPAADSGLFAATELVASKSAARRAINEGRAYLNNVKIAAAEACRKRQIWCTDDGWSCAAATGTPPASKSSSHGFDLGRECP